eukprot:2563898-Prymnesium_polylepis.1
MDDTHSCVQLTSPAAPGTWHSRVDLILVLCHTRKVLLQLCVSEPAQDGVEPHAPRTERAPLRSGDG